MTRIFIIVILLFSLQSHAQNNVPGQNDKYPLHTMVSADFIARIKNDPPAALQDANMKKVESLAANGDPEALYLMGIMYDDQRNTNTSATDAAKAMEYYKKAAELNVAAAEMQLFGVYTYGFLNTAVNEKTGMSYADRVILHGDDSLKLECYAICASIYAMKNTPSARATSKSYLEKVLAIDPRNSFALDALGACYEQEKNFKKAAELYLRSSNDQSRLTVAGWLMHGKRLPKDKLKAMEIVQEVMINFEKQGYNLENMSSYMGAQNPVLMLNHFYLCDKSIAKEELGKWYISSYACDEGDQFGH